MRYFYTNDWSAMCLLCERVLLRYCQHVRVGFGVHNRAKRASQASSALCGQNCERCMRICIFGSGPAARTAFARLAGPTPHGRDGQTVPPQPVLRLAGLTMCLKQQRAPTHKSVLPHATERQRRRQRWLADWAGLFGVWSMSAPSICACLCRSV